MDIVPRPVNERCNDNFKLKGYYLKVIESKPNAISTDLNELTPADVAQLYRFAKKDRHKFHTSVIDGKRLMWID